MNTVHPPRPRVAAEQPLLPTHVIALLRQELPTLCEEIMSEICTAVPEFAPLVRGSYRESAHTAVVTGLSGFVDELSTPGAPSPERDRLYRELGELQAPSEDGLRRLEAAIRVTVRVSWKRALMIFGRHQVPALFHQVLADRLFRYVDEATALAREGYRRALAQQAPGVHAHRVQLARELLAGGASEQALRRLADRARWELPGQVTVLVAGQGAMTDQARLDNDVLLDVKGGTTVLVIPGDVAGRRARMVGLAVHRARLASGPTTALTDAPESFRLARHALRLAEAGVIDEQRLVRSEDHLLTLWLAADPRLGERLVGRQLGSFDGLPPARRRRMLDTLRCWLETHGDAQEMADQLALHPQTVRYRVRALRTLVGPDLDDPEWRICTELTLRSLGLAERLAQAPLN